MTPKERAAMQQALEALEGVLKTGDTQVLEYTAPPAITALREALAASEWEEDNGMSIAEIFAKQEALAERKVLTMTQEEMVDAIRSAKIEQAEQEPVACPDKGLWTVKQWGTDKVVLLSNDFTHDVGLTISGDFLDVEQRLDYALNLAAWMNQHLQNAATQTVKQEPVGTAGELFTMSALERLDVRPSTKVYLDAAPVRTKDLTDDEIAKVCSEYTSDLFKARAVIAADREKNRA